MLRDVEYLSTGWRWVEDYVRGSTGLLATVESLGGEKHYHLDHLGTPRLVTNLNRQVAARHVLAPYGEELTSTDQDELRMKFTGHERDTMDSFDEDGDLDYMHARHYAGQIARFTSPDPILGAPTNPQSWNRYSYAWGSPLLSRDPTGAYVVNCSDGDTGCQNDADAFEDARQDDLQSKDDAVRKAALSYGDRGEENGIMVTFADLEDADGTTAPWAQGDADGSYSLAAKVTIQSGLTGTALKAALAHEGQHLLDASAFVATMVSLPAAPYVTYDISKNLTQYQTETNAFRLTHSVFKTAGERYSTGCRGCVLGAGVNSQAQAQRAINKILGDPSGVYRVTPEKPGPRQLRDWQ